MRHGVLITMIAFSMGIMHEDTSSCIATHPGAVFNGVCTPVESLGDTGKKSDVKVNLNTDFDCPDPSSDVKYWITSTKVKTINNKNTGHKDYSIFQHHLNVSGSKRLSFDEENAYLDSAAISNWEYLPSTWTVMKKRQDLAKDCRTNWRRRRVSTDQKGNVLKEYHDGTYLDPTTKNEPNGNDRGSTWEQTLFWKMGAKVDGVPVTHRRRCYAMSTVQSAEMGPGRFMKTSADGKNDKFAQSLKMRFAKMAVCSGRQCATKKIMISCWSEDIPKGGKVNWKQCDEGLTDIYKETEAAAIMARS